ncbi:hypothetical protein GGI23_006172 [Coemansia sp. RSA 2559]|nr:hypothetical protein GGI23_006172 [Coemansia sp. RSA 2559]KAJ2861306.1 hypothetical protein GGI22_002488 [Coemansia erecta]
MIKCRSCGYECDCMDLYYDHIMFDKKHQEMAQREATETAANSVPSRRSRTDLRAKRTSLWHSRRRQCSSPLTQSASASSSGSSSSDSSPVVASKQSLVVGTTGY